MFLIALVVWRRVRPRPASRPPLRSCAGIGVGASFLSALLGTVGRVMAPLFLAYGLVKRAYIGTEALATVVTHVVRLVAYGGARALPPHALAVGLALGPVMVAGSYAGTRIVDQLPDALFVAVIELTMLAAGLPFLIRG